MDFVRDAGDASCHIVYITGLSEEEYSAVRRVTKVQEQPDDQPFDGVVILDWFDDAIDASMVEIKEI